MNNWDLPPGTLTSSHRYLPLVWLGCDVNMTPGWLISDPFLVWCSDRYSASRWWNLWWSRFLFYLFSWCWVWKRDCSKIYKTVTMVTSPTASMLLSTVYQVFVLVYHPCLRLWRGTWRCHLECDAPDKQTKKHEGLQCLQEAWMRSTILLTFPMLKKTCIHSNISLKATKLYGNPAAKRTYPPLVTE